MRREPNLARCEIRRRRLRGLFAGIGMLAVVLPPCAGAQAVSGRRIIYQGILAGSTSRPTIHFSIYRDATSTVVKDRLWGPESHVVRPDSEGNILVVLGETLNLDKLDPTIPWYLDVAVTQGGATVTLTPRQQLFAAFHATSASTSLGVVPGGVGRAAIQNGAIDATKIEDGAIGSADIGNGQITATQLGSGAVWSSHIRDGEVKNADIGASAVSNSKISNNSVTGDKIVNGAIANAELGLTLTDGNVSTSAVSSQNLGTKQFCALTYVSFDANCHLQGGAGSTWTLTTLDMNGQGAALCQAKCF